MSVHLVYYPGGEIPTAPQRNRAQLWDGTAVTYTEWALDGTVITTRPLTADEVAGLASLDTDNLKGTNRVSLQAAVQTRLAQVETFIANNPTGAVLTAAQTNALARMVVALARLTLDLTATVGQGT